MQIKLPLTLELTKCLVPNLINFSSKRNKKRYIQPVNPKFKIGLVSRKEAGLFNDEFHEKLYTEVYKGKRVFRQRGSSVRISYSRLKKGLIKKQLVIKEPPLPF